MATLSGSVGSRQKKSYSRHFIKIFASYRRRGSTSQASPVDQSAPSCPGCTRYRQNEQIQALRDSGRRCSTSLLLSPVEMHRYSLRRGCLGPPLSLCCRGAAAGLTASTADRWLQRRFAATVASRSIAPQGPPQRRRAGTHPRAGSECQHVACGGTGTLEQRRLKSAHASRTK